MMTTCHLILFSIVFLEWVTLFEQRWVTSRELRSLFGDAGVNVLPFGVLHGLFSCFCVVVSRDANHEEAAPRAGTVTGGERPTREPLCPQGKKGRMERAAALTGFAVRPMIAARYERPRAEGRRPAYRSGKTCLASRGWHGEMTGRLAEKLKCHAAS